MNKNLKISVLLDYYKEMLTVKQADALDLYYNHDLSLAEISQNMNISRQGVRDTIKRGERALYDIEIKLGLTKKSELISKQITIILDSIKNIEKLHCNKKEKLKDDIEIIKDSVKEIIENI